MDVRVVVRVVMLRAAGHAARLAGGRQGEVAVVIVVVRKHLATEARLVIAHRRPGHRLAEEGGIHSETIRLILGIEALVVGVVAEHQPHVGRTAAGETRVGVAHRVLRGEARAEIADGPDAHWLPCARHRRGGEKVGGVARQFLRRGPDVVKVFRERAEVRERNFVFRDLRCAADAEIQIPRVCSEAHPRVRRCLRAPAHHDVARGADLQIRPAPHPDRVACEFQIKTQIRTRRLVLMHLHRDDVETFHEQRGAEAELHRVGFLGVSESRERESFMLDSSARQVVAHHFEAVHVHHGSVVAQQAEREGGVLRRFGDVDVGAEVGGDELVLVVRAVAQSGRFVAVAVAELAGANVPSTVVKTGGKPIHARPVARVEVKPGGIPRQ